MFQHTVSFILNAHERCILIELKSGKSLTELTFDQNWVKPKG